MCECISIETFRYQLNTHFIICTNVLVTSCHIRDGKNIRTQFDFICPVIDKREKFRNFSK